MDNCWRENKNHFVFGFLSWLVICQLVFEVKVSFLMVGHTHHDNDQFFGAIGKNIRRKEALTWIDLVNLIRNSHPELSVEVKTLEEIVDFASFIGVHMNHIVNISKPHHYHFGKIDNVVSFRSRMYKDTQWSQWMAVFKLDNFPSSQPQLLTVSSVKVITNHCFSPILLFP